MLWLIVYDRKWGPPESRLSVGLSRLRSRDPTRRILLRESRAWL